MKTLNFVICLLLCNLALAQQPKSKNMVSVAGGVNIMFNANNKMSFGAAVESEYQYTLSKYIGIVSGIGYEHNKYNDKEGTSDFTIENKYSNVRVWLGAMYTPFPDNFRWIKVGSAFAYIHDRGSYFSKIYNVQRKNISNEVGFNFTLRGYVIDNYKYALFASYNLQTRFKNKFDFKRSITSVTTIGFGYKF